jgi:serine/threonine protein kinase
MLELEETRLNHYTIQSRLAHGGMSDIYLAHDEQGQTVAIKVVHRSQDDFFMRFQREVKALRDLTHDHILPVLDCGEDGSWHYCVMPYIRTGTLRDRIRKETLSMEEAGIILNQVASALQYAHDTGILHRDLKPSNILLTDDNHAYLADFGLAKGIEENSEVTQTGCLIGTPEYMAPELAELPATTSSDIYALGVLLYQMLTGQVPFRGSTPLSIYWKHIQERPTPPSRLNPAISYGVEQVILCALEKDPTRRFQSAQAMAEAYTRALQASSQTQAASSLLVPFAPDRDTLPPPVQRVIPITAVHTKRGIHPAFIALAAVFFLLILPLTLGFTTVYLKGNGTHVSAALGASAQFTKLNGLTPEVSPQARSTTTPTTTTTTTTTTTVRSYTYPQGRGNTNRGGKDGGKGGGKGGGGGKDGGGKGGGGGRGHGRGD